MSVYNLARYNLAKFNVVQADSIWAVGRARTTVAFSYAGITNLVIGNAAVRFDAEQMRLDPGRMIIGSTGMTFANQSKVNAYFWRQATGAPGIASGQARAPEPCGRDRLPQKAGARLCGDRQCPLLCLQAKRESLMLRWASRSTARHPPALPPAMPWQRT